jgi:hypothetical protein
MSTSQKDMKVEGENSTNEPIIIDDYQLSGKAAQTIRRETLHKPQGTARGVVEAKVLLLHRRRKQKGHETGVLSRQRSNSDSRKAAQQLSPGLHHRVTPIIEPIFPLKSSRNFICSGYTLISYQPQPLFAAKPSDSVLIAGQIDTPFDGTALTHSDGNHIMSGSAYRLESGRLRPPPPPLRFESSSLKSNSSLSNNITQKAPQALLYDLPSTSSIASPPSTGGFSPTSPSSTGWSRGGRKTRPTSPSSRNRSITPSGVAPSELEVFAEHCRAWSVTSLLAVYAEC